MSETFVKTFQRDHLGMNPLPDAQTALRQIHRWIIDYKKNPPALSALDALPKLRLNSRRVR